jgi:hypothetical protein
MKPVIKLLASALLLASASNASAWWGDGWGGGWNPWPVWTPMYWMEEMVGDDDWYGPYGYGGYPYGGYGGYPYGGGYGGYPYGGYGGYPYGGYGGYPYGGNPYGGYGYGAPWR